MEQKLLGSARKQERGVELTIAEKKGENLGGKEECREGKEVVL